MSVILTDDEGAELACWIRTLQADVQRLSVLCSWYETRNLALENAQRSPKPPKVRCEDCGKPARLTTRGTLCDRCWSDDDEKRNRTRHAA